MQHHDKITHALETCLAYARETERPFQQAADFFLVLRHSDGWSDSEISQVKTLALTGLMKRARDGQPENEPNP